MQREILIRKWQKEDAGELTAIANNKKIWLNVRDRFPHPYTVKDAMQWVTFTAEQNPTQSFAIVYNGKIAGSVGILLKDDVYRKSIEVGYFIGEPFWGKGIATQALVLLLQYVEQNFDVIRIFAEVFETNKASMRVLEKCGFHLEGIRKKAVVKNNIVLDDHVWVKLLA